MVLEVSSKNSTLTWVTPPLEPVLPRTLITFASVTGVLVSYEKLVIMLVMMQLCKGDISSTAVLEFDSYGVIVMFY